MVLSRRLQTIADFVPQGSVVADIGTDHGYIPVWLLSQGICPRAIASDLKEEPLKNAMCNAKSAGVYDRITFYCAPGLEACAPEDADVIILAGMGGETMIDILSKATWTHQKKLILQPQTKIYELRRWLNENGFEVYDAALVDDTGRIYTVWSVAAGQAQELSEAECYIDRQIIRARDPLLGTYLEALIKKMLFKIGGLEKSPGKRPEELVLWKKTLQEFYEMRKELDNADSKGDQ